MRAAKNIDLFQDSEKPLSVKGSFEFLASVHWLRRPETRTAAPSAYRESTATCAGRSILFVVSAVERVIQRHRITVEVFCPTAFY